MQSLCWQLFQLAVYNLKIVAVDAGVPALTSTAEVTVELLDVNDSPPQFTNDNFTATVMVSLHYACLWDVLRNDALTATSRLCGWPRHD